MEEDPSNETSANHADKQLAATEADVVVDEEKVAQAPAESDSSEDKSNEELDAKEKQADETSKTEKSVAETSATEHAEIKEEEVHEEVSSADDVKKEEQKVTDMPVEEKTIQKTSTDKNDKAVEKTDTTEEKAVEDEAVGQMDTGKVEVQNGDEVPKGSKLVDDKVVTENNTEDEGVNTGANKYLESVDPANASTSGLSYSTDSSLRFDQDLSVISENTQPPKGGVTQKVEELEGAIAANVAEGESPEATVAATDTTANTPTKEDPEQPLQDTPKEEFVIIKLDEDADLDNTSATDLEQQALDPVRQEVQTTVESITRSYKKTKEKRQQYRCIFTLAIIALAMTVTIIVVPVYLFGINNKDDSTSPSETQVSNEADKTGPKDIVKKDPKEPKEPASVPVPNVSGTTEPSIAPIAEPTAAPSTMEPSAAPSTAEPTAAPTSAPTSTIQFPDSELLQAIKAVLVDPKVLEVSSTNHYQAYKWMTADNSFVEEDNMDKMIQRYVITLLSFFVREGDTYPLFADVSDDHCSWYGVTCDDNDMVTKLAWPNQSLSGMLPEDIRLLTTLESLDLAENSLYGELPEGLWELTELQYLYLHQNQFTGGLSESVGNLNFIRLYLGNNNLSGPLPLSLGAFDSGRNRAPDLEWLNLHDNNFTGQLPADWSLRNLFYLDLGMNDLSGTVPEEWVDGSGSMVSLRSLYLDFNRLSGSLPNGFDGLGKGRLRQIVLRDNNFSGEVSGASGNFLLTVEVQNNNFTSISDSICRQIVWAKGGELVTVRADCQACTCEYFCDQDECY